MAVILEGDLSKDSYGSDSFYFFRGRGLSFGSATMESLCHWLLIALRHLQGNLARLSITLLYYTGSLILFRLI